MAPAGVGGDRSSDIWKRRAVQLALNHLPEDLIQNRGRYVAWSMDGSRVLASGATIGEMYDETHRLGLIGGEFVAEYVPQDV